MHQSEKSAVDLAKEHETHEITIYVNNQAFKTTQRELTGAQIKALAGIPSEYELFRVDVQGSLPQ